MQGPGRPDLNEGARAGITPTAMAYNALLEAHTAAGDLDAADALVEDMQAGQVLLLLLSTVVLLQDTEGGAEHQDGSVDYGVFHAAAASFG